MSMVRSRGHASMSKNAKRKADGLGRVVELEKEGFYPGGDERRARGPARA